MHSESGDELRLPWCDVRRVCIKGQRLIVEGDATSLSLPLPAHAAAASRVVAEAATRIGDRVDVSPADHERLPRPSDDDSTRVPAPRLQLAGRKCAASGKSITFETDARRCDNCGALYHVAHVPESCVCCGQSLGAREGDARAATRAG